MRSSARHSFVASLTDALDAHAAARPDPGPAARAPAESRRVRQRDSRSAGARDRSGRPAARQTTRPTASTTLPTCWACRRCCSSGTCRPPARSARWPSAIRTAASAMRNVPRPAGRVAGPARRRAADRNGRRHARAHHAAARRRVRRFSPASSGPISVRCAGSSTQHQIEITVDGARVHLASFGGDEDFKASLKNPTLAGDDVEARARARVPLNAGSAHHWRRVHREDGGAEQLAAAAVPAQLARHVRSDWLSAPRRLLGHRAVQPDRARRHAEPPQDLHVPSGDGRRRRAVRAPDRLDAGASGVSRTGHRRGHAAADVVLRDRPAQRAPSTSGIQLALQRMLASAKFALRIERDPADVGARLGVSAQRSRPGVAAVVLPVEQHSGRRAAARRRAGPAAHACGAAAAGPTHARRSEVGGARHQLRRPVALPAQPEEHGAAVHRVRRLRRQPAAGVRARDGAVLRERHAREPQRARSDDGRLHVRQRAAGEALRHSRRLRQPLPPRDAHRRGAPRHCSARARS